MRLEPSSELEKGNMFTTYALLVTEVVLNLALAILCSQKAPRCHAPWAMLATWLACFGWGTLSVQLAVHHAQAWGRVAAPSVKEQDVKGVGEYVFTGGVWSGLFASCSLTASAIWVTSYVVANINHKCGDAGEASFFNAFDVWVPVAIASHAATVPSFVTTIDLLARVTVQPQT